MDLDFRVLIAQLVQRRSRDQMSRGRFPVRAVGECSSPELLSALTLSDSVSVPSNVLPQWHLKDPGHSAKSVGGRLHLNTHTPLTHRSQSGVTRPSRQSVGTYQGSELTHNSSGKRQSTVFPARESYFPTPTRSYLCFSLLFCDLAVTYLFPKVQ